VKWGYLENNPMDYFHDGSAATLADVVDFYDKGGNPNRNLDPAMHPLHLSAQQKADLVQFLNSLKSCEMNQIVRENESEQEADPVGTMIDTVCVAQEVPEVEH
jgi:cytochrome c peroxidase